MNNSKFKVGESVVFTSKSEPSASGNYIVENVEYVENGITVSDDKSYKGYVYQLKDIDMVVAETSLTLG